jgi:D-alanyl-D-alanine carboxypeptidase/D-alanyl-D-alanine-endopeptidase (penicillin-binding protein 4)
MADLRRWRADRVVQTRSGVSWRTGLLAAIAIGVSTLAANAQSLERKVRDALGQARLGTAKVGVYIYDVTRGVELVDIRVGGVGDRGMIPASNLKLLTSGAALAQLGPDFEFRTTLVLDGDLLVIRGSGDPALADPELLSTMGIDLNTMLDRLVSMAKQTAGPGVAIRGVVLDDRVFDRESVHPEWPREQLHLAYCAPVSGLNFHANLMNVYVEPARSQPEAPWIIVKRSLKRVKTGQNELRLDREPSPAGTEEPLGGYTFKLSGNLRSPPDGPVQVTVDRACLMLGRLIGDRLIKEGMAAAGLTSQTLPVRLIGATEEIGTRPGAKELAAVKTPLRVVLERCNKDSDNLYAESLLKAMGHHATGQAGSWSNGTAVVRMQVRDRLGSDFASQLVMSDGSGLSRGNRVSTEMLGRWLANIASDPRIGPAFVESLPTVGEGTLKRRFKGSKLHCDVRGKSGYIRQVRALSGYVTEPTSGRRIAYSIMVNDIPPSADAKSKEFHEDVVEAIDAMLARDAASGGGAAEGSKSDDTRERIGG